MASNTGDSSKMDLRGVELEVVRKGSGPPLFVLHGGGGPVASFPFVDKLAERFEIILPTHPGFGGSPIPDHFDNIHDLKFLYLDLMDALDLRDAAMMGFSMGGWTACEIAVMTTERLSKLVLVDSVGIKPGDRETRDIADVFGVPAEELIKLTWHDTSKAPDMESWDDEQMAVYAGNRIALGLYTWEPYMHNPKLPHRLHRIDIPTLLIWGESDRLVTPTYGEALRAMIPGAEMVVVPEAGHAPQAEQPEAFVDHVMSFLA